jgi:WhiB family redox-sensing transcriptional regulator
MDDTMRPAWHREAVCRGLGARGFVKSPGAAYGLRELCATCPVRPECLEFALADLTIVGLWGGTDDAERRGMRRQVA